MEKVLVIGVGNLLMKDDGIGIHLVQQLSNISLPSGVEVIDGGTASLNLLSYMEKAGNIIIIDALAGGGTPASIYKLTPQDITVTEEENYSLHDSSLINTLTLLNSMGANPETVIFGVEPKEISYGLELTPEIEKIMPKLRDLVLNEINETIAKGES